MTSGKKILSTVFLTLCLSSAGGEQKGFYAPSWFRTPRPEPLTEVHTAKRMDVTDFGAKPNDGEDDYQAIERAVTYLVNAKGDAQLHFPRGKYDITPPADRESHCFTLTGCSNFAIVADGAEIVIHNPAKGFLRLQDCRQGVIQGFSIDYAPLPYTQGVITQVNSRDNTFEVKIEDGFPSPLASNFREAPTKWASVLTESGGVTTLKRGSLNLIPAQRITGEEDRGIFSIKTSPAAVKEVAEGNLYALIARYNGRPAFSIQRCERITFMDNTCYAGPAGGFAIGNSPEINMLRCNVLRKPGRYISQNADCVHVTPSTIGPWIEGCIFEGQMDDAINLKTEMLNILEVREPERFLVSGNVAKGDSLSLFNPREGRLIGRCKVLLAVKEKANTEITISRKFEGIKAGGKDKEADMFFNDNRSNESFVIRGNTFRFSRRYGILIQATHGTIEGNTFRSASTGAIILQNSAGWPEGFVPRNVHISGNTIVDCGFDASSSRETPPAPVIIRTNTARPEVKALWRGVTGIVLENNNIESNSACCIALSGVSGIVIRENKMTPQTPQSIFQENSDNVTIQSP